MLSALFPPLYASCLLLRSRDTLTEWDVWIDLFSGQWRSPGNQNYSGNYKFQNRVLPSHPMLVMHAFSAE